MLKKNHCKFNDFSSLDENKIDHHFLNAYNCLLYCTCRYLYV